MFSVNIMAHPAREAFIPGLLDELGRNTEVIWDRGVSVWDTRQRCLEHHLEQEHPFGVTIQDDAILPPGFLTRAAEFLHRRNPEFTYAVNFFFWSDGFSQTARRVAITNGFHESYSLHGGVAIGLPVTIIPDLIARENAHLWWKADDDAHRNDDRRIANYLRDRGVKIRYPCPSLVDHRDEGSLVYSPREMPRARKARTYAD